MSLVVWRQQSLDLLKSWFCVEKVNVLDEEGQLRDDHRYDYDKQIVDEGPAKNLEPNYSGENQHYVNC